MFYGFFYDWTYVLVLIGAVISMIASARVNSTFAKYAKVRSMSGKTGAEVATSLLNSAGIYDVPVERVSGNLTDHYDPRAKVLRLSDATYASNSVAAIGVAAHECGHAIQHQNNYQPLAIRNAIAPAAGIGSKLALPLILVGFLLSYNQVLIQLGIWVFAIAVLFQLVTLPVEYNASSRAVRLLADRGILSDTEIGQSKKVLDAAALTYVAAAAASILQLLRLVMLFGRRSDD